MSRRAKLRYEDLIVRRICEPLGMDSTRINVPEDLQARLAVGHREPGVAAKPWDFDVLAGAGAVRSSANDMLRYAAAQLDAAEDDRRKAAPAEKTPLAAGTRLSHQPRGKTDMPGHAQALSWFILKVQDEPTVFWHNGGTAGHRSWVGFVPDRGCGLVILSNCGALSNNCGDIDAIGFELIGQLARL